MHCRLSTVTKCQSATPSGKVYCHKLPKYRPISLGQLCRDLSRNMVVGRTRRVNSSCPLPARRPPKPKDPHAANRKRLSRTVSRGLLHSEMVRFGRDDRQDKYALKKLVKECAGIIHKDYFKDDLKMPLNNPAQSAMMANASLNIYFGVDLEHQPDNVIRRTAYGVGSGTSSIGLNPKTMCVYRVFNKLNRLMDLATRWVHQDPVRKQAMSGRSFNFCSVKVYYTTVDEKGKNHVKDTNWHSDVTFDQNGKPHENNSQVPGSPVAICTFGDDKLLEFRRHETKEIFEKESYIYLGQTNGSFFVLDGRDEKPSGRVRWWHRSRMANRTDAEAVCFSFMFRLVQKDVRVHKVTNTLVDPHIQDKWRNSERDEKKIFGRKHYKENRMEIDRKVQAVLDKYK